MVRDPKTLRSLGIVVALALGGCHRRAAPPEASRPAPSPPPIAAAHGLTDELTHEAKDRPTETPTVEAVLAAFAKGGITIARTQQVLGTPIGAHYCVAASSTIGLGMSICEYDSLEQAQRGRESSLRLFKTIPRRTLLVNEKTLATLILPSELPAIAAQRDAASKIFAALSPR